MEQAFAMIKAHLRKAEARTLTRCGEPWVTSAISLSRANAGTI
ncbi:hypothetical protein [Microvirga sp. M2]